MADGLATSFLDAFQTLSGIDMARKRERDTAIQESIRNAITMHGQELEQQRLSQSEKYQQEELDIRKGELKLREKTEKRTSKRDEDTAAYHRGLLDIRTLSMDSANRRAIRASRDKNFALMKRLGYDESVAAQIADEEALRGLDFGSSQTQSDADPLHQGPFVPSQPDRAFSGIGSLGSISPSIAPQRKITVPYGPAPIIQAKMDLQKAQTAELNEKRTLQQTMASLDKQYKEAQIAHVKAQAGEVKERTKLLPEQFRQRKLYENGRLVIEKINAEAHRLEALTKSKEPGARAALEMAKQNATSLRQYSRQANTEYRKQVDLQTKAIAASAFAGHYIEQYDKDVKKGVVKDAHDQELHLAMRSQWNEYNNVNPATKTSRMQDIHNATMERKKDWDNAVHAAENFEAIYKKGVTSAGKTYDVVPYKPTPGDLKPLSASQIATLDKNKARNLANVRKPRTTVKKKVNDPLGIR